jgi:hypothetical protein
MWVRQNKYFELTGEKRATFSKLRADGQLADGIHYRLDPLGRVWVNTEAMTAWVTGQAPRRNSRRA